MIWLVVWVVFEFRVIKGIVVKVGYWFNFLINLIGVIELEIFFMRIILGC